MEAPILFLNETSLLDLSNVENGIYFLSINTEGKVFNKRIIKE